MTDDLRRQWEEIRAASEKATPGPWVVASAESIADDGWPEHLGRRFPPHWDYYLDTDDADLIVLLRNLAPALAEHTLRLLDGEKAGAHERAARIRRCLNVLDGAEFEADDFPSMEDALAAARDLDVLVARVQELHDAMAACGLPETTPVEGFVRHHRNNAALAAGLEAEAARIRAERGDS